MKVLTDKILSFSACTAEIDTPVDQLDIAEWLFNLPEAEYQRCCPPDHVSCGTTATDDGRPMSINVEMIGTGLVIQHYVAEEYGKAYCRMNSISDVFTPNGRTQVNVIWELLAEPLEGGPDDVGRDRFAGDGQRHVPHRADVLSGAGAVDDGKTRRLSHAYTTPSPLLARSGVEQHQIVPVDDLALIRGTELPGEVPRRPTE